MSIVFRLFPVVLSNVIVSIPFLYPFFLLRRLTSCVTRCPSSLLVWPMSLLSATVWPFGV